MSAAATRNWLQVGTLSDIPRRGARCIKGPGLTIALFRTVDDHVFAMEDKCPHRDGPLSQGIVHDECVTCPLHNWVISLKTGQAQGADEGAVRTLPVRIDGEAVLVDFTDVAPARLPGAA